MEHASRILSAEYRARALRRPARHGVERDSDMTDNDVLAAVSDLEHMREELRAWHEDLEEQRSDVAVERSRCEAMFDNAPDAYLLTDTQSTITRANVAAGRLLGIEPRFLLGKPLTSFVDSAGRRAFRKQLDSLCGAHLSAPWSFDLRRRDGSVVIVEVTLTMVRGLPSDAVELRWLLRDVTKQKRAEARIRELNATLEQRVAERTRQLAEQTQRLERVLAERDSLVSALNHDIRAPLQSILAYSALIEMTAGRSSTCDVRDYVARIGQSTAHVLAVIDRLSGSAAPPGAVEATAPR
jgi:PAS domain S-box-containing protein